ncbi:MAG: SGNH/GDSL hydrolase family protein [Pseudonocardiaceae bacterium]|nr:SGNH/GDSL hydrolase family protein [Pseudonocardiaceae bacterium]
MLGDSTAVGLGDPIPGGRWRGVGPLLAEALGAPDYLNVAFTGARARCVRVDQLPEVYRFRPDVAVLVVGMNDALRSDFDAEAVRADLDHVVATLTELGTVVLTVRFHDHGRVFRLPGPLRRALQARIEELNGVTDAVTHARGVPCLDLDVLPEVYQLDAWSVDRLHPSERGHRLLANGFAELLAAAGIAVPAPVPLDCSDGLRTGTHHHVAWLVCKGVPWLWRRGRDLLPYAAALMLRSALPALSALREMPASRGTGRGAEHPERPRLPAKCGD